MYLIFRDFIDVHKRNQSDWLGSSLSSIPSHDTLVLCMWPYQLCKVWVSILVGSNTSRFDFTGCFSSWSFFGLIVYTFLFDNYIIFHIVLISIGILPEISSNFAVQRQNNHGFSAVACDKTIEQTANRDSKTKGGLIGFSMNPGTVHR